ncbi:jg22789, partial [Pararge aegeria aegeria]
LTLGAAGPAKSRSFHKIAITISCEPRAGAALARRTPVYYTTASTLHSS